MLDPKIVVNLVLEFGVRVDLMRHGNLASVKDSRAAREVSDEGLGANGGRASVP